MKLLLFILLIAGCSNINSVSQNTNGRLKCSRDQISKLVELSQEDIEFPLHVFLANFDSLKWSTLDHWMFSVESRGKHFDRLFVGRCASGAEEEVFYAGIRVENKISKVVFVMPRPPVHNSLKALNR